ncbi:MAG: redoxin domain-containing protein [Pirellulaceae bacterium]
MTRQVWQLPNAAKSRWLCRWLVPVICLGSTAPALPNLSAEEPSPQLVKALTYQPRQADVKYEKVAEPQLGECSIEEVTRDDGTGFLVSGPAGQPLRWFADTDGDKRLDRWSYYNAGVEVYRESDIGSPESSRPNGTADEYRWLSTEGLRWGSDKDEDGEIDSWSMISAEEVTAEAVRATANRDSERFSRLLITEAEIRELGLGTEKQELLLQRIADAKKQFEAWSGGQNVVSPKGQWTNFGADKPGIVPAGTDGSKKDVVVYENAVALLEDAGEARQLLVGTIIQVGNRWRLVDLPRGISEGAVMDDSGVFFSATFTPKGATGGPIATSGISKAMERLVTELQEVDGKLVKGEGDTAALQARRADVLEKLISAAASEDERQTWIRQFADTVSTAAQTGDYPTGVARLKEFSEKLETVKASTEDLAYVAFRTLTAEHNYRMQQPKAEYEKLQEEYLGNLRQYVRDYPASQDAAEAMIQIALSAEFTGEVKEAAEWYAQAAKNFGDMTAGKKAEGALRRLNLAGKPFSIKGNTLDGRGFSSDSYVGGPVVYHCWASWCEGCKAEMRALKELQAKYAKQKLRVVGINLDNQAAQGAAFLKQNSFPWVHLYDEGGLESTLAVGYGVLTLPANFIVDKEGKVVKTGVHWTELESVIEGLVK